MVSKHSELMKRHAQDRYGRFASPLSSTVPPPSCQEVGSLSHRHITPPPLRMQEVGSSSHCHTTPPPSRQEEASSDDSVEMWVVTPPPPTCLVAPPPRLEVASSSDDCTSDSSSYNNECSRVKEVSSYELLLDFNYLVQLLNVYMFIFRFKS
jgi:hypothetical protein